MDNGFSPVWPRDARVIMHCTDCVRLRMRLMKVMMINIYDSQNEMMRMMIRLIKMRIMII